MNYYKSRVEYLETMIEHLALISGHVEVGEDCMILRDWCERVIRGFPND